MFDCRYCGRYTRLRPCCTSVECTRRNEEYDRYAAMEARERGQRRKGITDHHPPTTKSEIQTYEIPEHLYR